MATMDCPTCFGEGSVEELRCRVANWRECCGGCTVDVPCADCDGTGEVEVEADDADAEAA